VFVITGGGSGIGKALALALCLRNESVLIVGRRKEALLDVQRQASNIETFQADISTIEGRETLIDFLKQKTPIKGLINNAGILEPVAPISQITHAQWQAIMATNVDAPLFLTQQLQPHLQGSRVLNIGSGLAHFPAKGLAAYCVSKAALHMLTRCFQMENNGIFVTSVMPGIIDTNMQKTLRLSEAVTEENRQFYTKLKQSDRLVSPTTVASFLTWLLLDIPNAQFTEKEWDIYDTTHHKAWLKPNDCVPSWNE
jgi:benzil reductase ((S)-benzoin forming)